MDTKDILNQELTEEEAAKLAEAIQTWKEDFSAKLEEEAAAKLQAKLDELDEQNNAWREEVAEAYSDKFIAALDEMREDVRAEVVAESVATDPAHKVMEEVVRLVAPLMNEEYEANTYMSEIKTLKEQLDAYKHKEELAEGAKALEELIENYNEDFKPALRALIGEGTVEEVTAKFESILESLNAVSEEAEEPEAEEEFEDEDFDFEDDEEEEIEEDEEFSTIVEEEKEEVVEEEKKSALRNSMMRLF